MIRMIRFGCALPLLFAIVFPGSRAIAQATGACCSPTGQCVVTTREECESVGRNYQGDGTDCDPNPCDVAIGACCFPDTTCQIMGIAPCAVAGGIYQGNDTSCEPLPCTPIGACCLSGGLCTIAEEQNCVDGDGAYAGDGTTCIPDLCTVVGVGAEPARPERIRLSGPFPNPTRGILHYRIELPREARLRARLVDVTGRIVRELLDGVYPPGVHSLTWYPTSEDASSTPSGVYFLRVEAEGTGLTRQVVLAH